MSKLLKSLFAPLSKIQTNSKSRRRALQMESLEVRWTPAWTDLPPATISVPTTTTAVTFNASNDASGSASIATTEVDYYSFLAPTSGTYRFATSTPSSSLDTVLGVFSGSGQRLAYNDDIIRYYNTDSQVSVNLTAGTRYYLGITNYTSSAAGSYSWLIDGPATTTTTPVTDDAYEQNDSFSAAKSLGAVAGTKTIPDLVLADNDWYSFSIGQAGTSADYVQLAFQHAQGDIDVELYNSAGTRLAVSESATNSETISLNGRAAGTYYVRVYGYQNATNPKYALTIQGPQATTTTGVDLQGSSLAVTDSSNWGQTVTVQAAVRNAGTAAAGAFQVQWVLSRDTTYSSDDVVLSIAGGGTSRAFTGLGASSTSTFSTSLVLPSALPSGWTGSNFYVVMRTDSANQVVETNEANNAGQIGAAKDYDPITVTAASTGGGTGGFQITLNITGMTASQQALFQQAAARWSQVITGDLPNATYQGVAVDDLLIDASGTAIDGVNGVLGQAGPDAFRSGTRIPYHGSMEFDTADLTAMERNGTLLGVIIHEMGHVLGIGTIWEMKGLIAGAGTANSRFTGAQATAEYNRIFNASAAGVPLETGGGAGTRDGHWSEAILNTEIMTGYVENAGVAMPLSRITVAALADMGYTVNMAAADAFNPLGLASVNALASNSTGSSSSSATSNAVNAAWFTSLNSPSSDTTTNATPCSGSHTTTGTEQITRPTLHQFWDEFFADLGRDG